MPESQAIRLYNEIVKEKLLPLDIITHNAVILFVLEIFERYAEVKKFYQNFYKLIVVDEFQDANCIAWALLEEITTDNTQLLFLGDPLQRIYGFIGALPNIMASVVVILGDMERWLFPGYHICDGCTNKFVSTSNCRCTLPSVLSSSFRDVILDELSVFYVGITRAKKQVFVSASAKRLDYYGNEKDSIFSCMASMPGIKLVKAL